MTTEEKQNFLREQILEKGYDTNEFVQFLTDKKGPDGADVSNWVMDDLKLVVNEFIKNHGGTVEEEPKKIVKKVSMFDIMGDAKPKTNLSQSQMPPNQAKKITKPESPKNQNPPQKTPPQNQPSTTPVTTTNNTTTTTSTNLNFSGTEGDYGIITEETKKCKTLEQTDFFKHDKLEITVSNPEKKDGGFFF